MRNDEGHVRLGVNIDHVATLRQARGTEYPSLLQAMVCCENGGADGLTIHLREDRRHIQDADLFALRKAARLPLNLEMANCAEIVDIALRARPDEVCLVPERRQELTTEGGLDAAGQVEELRPTVERLTAAGIRVSLFIDPLPEQVAAAVRLKVPMVELHTGKYSLLSGVAREEELKRLEAAAVAGHTAGLQINAGHGLNYDNVGTFLRAVPYIHTLNIGHSIVARAVFDGLETAVRNMAARAVTGGLAAAAGGLGDLLSGGGETGDGIPSLSGAMFTPLFPPRRRDTHKGDYGHVLLLGGNADFPGAIVLAAEGAARSGVGLVCVAASAPAVTACLCRLPEVIARADVWANIAMNESDAILAGPGLGCDPEARRLVARLLHEASCPLVLDADAITMLADHPEALRSCAWPVVITPHPGELAQLLGTTPDAVQSDRVGAARSAVALTGAVVVLKGAGTLVAAPGGGLWRNSTGNSGMACGGSGDVLAGLLTGLLGQGMQAVEAAKAAVWLHGFAGDTAARRLGETAMGAMDIAMALPAAFRAIGA